MNSREIIERLMSGNREFIEKCASTGDFSQSVRKSTAINGQSPYALVLTCGDSRVDPNAIFSAGIGEIFTVRIAGNVVNTGILGSIEYACRDLGVRFVLVLGHTRCGAVNAAMGKAAGLFLSEILDEIRTALNGETDDRKACELNVARSVGRITDELKHIRDICVRGAVYDIESGKVDILET